MLSFRCDANTATSTHDRHRCVLTSVSFVFEEEILSSSARQLLLHHSHRFWMWLMPEITFARFTVPTSTFFSHGCSKHYGTHTTQLLPAPPSAASTDPPPEANE